MAVFHIVYNSCWSVYIAAKNRAKARYLGYLAINGAVRTELSFKEFMAKTTCHKTTDAQELGKVRYMPAF